jgi:2'-5' RNA ligase
MTQSVELILDAAADAAIRAQWDRLGDAGLPTARRPGRSPHHAPHLTLWAGDAVSAEAEATLPALFADLDLELVIGSLLLFGPSRGSYVLVRSVPVSAALGRLQRRVAEVCSASPGGQFGDGRWSPHITLARRVAVHQVGPALAVLGDAPAELAATVRQARRWDGDRKRAWWLSRP